MFPWCLELGVRSFSWLLSPLLALCVLTAFSAHAEGDVAGCTEGDLLDALDGGGFVTFTNDCSITLSAPIIIDLDTTIDAQGHQVTINGGDLTLLFQVEPDVTNFTAIGLTLSGGQNTNGGALYIYQGATVVLSNCTFEANTAAGEDGTDGADGANSATGSGGNGKSGTLGTTGLGGAVFNLGDLTLINCTLATNTVTGGDGGNGGKGGNGGGNLDHGGNGGNGGAGGTAYGGAIHNLGALVVSNCTFSGNSVTGGNAGAGAAGGTGYVAGLAGSGGAGGTGSGAAIYSTQPITVINCTFAFNTGQGGNSADGGTSSDGNGAAGPRGAESLGGGVCTVAGGALTNCTFFNNTTKGGDGGDGGLAVRTLGTGGNGGNGGTASGGGLYSVGTIDVVNCTFSSCGATGGTNGVGGSGPFPGSNGSAGASRGGNLASGGGAFWLKNSIVATNLSGGNGYGTITDGGRNISSDASISLGSDSKKSVDARISTLADNGGPTKTIALKTNSPAVDYADTAAAPAFDQRGVRRPLGASADSGAYELAALPIILIQPASQNQTNGGSVTFFVSAIGEPPLIYRWRFNGGNISGAVATNYTIAHVAATNAGTYDVIVSNRFGLATSSPATLTVSVPPAITSQPTNQTVIAGATATFTVSATGDAPLSYQWQFKGTNISGATGSTYTVANAQATNAGTYTVSITNDAGSIVSSPATLTVNLPPSITTQPASQTVTIGSSVTFSVVASGATNLTYQWRFYGTNIPNAAGVSYTKSNVQFSDAGPYDVVVSNSFGTTDSALAFLTVTQPLLSGRVLEGSNGLSGVTLLIGTNAMLTTAADGTFSTNLPPGTYSVTPSRTNYAFDPATISVVLPPSTNLTFLAVPTFTISGRVFEGSTGLSGVTVTADTKSDVSDANGNYTITGVRAGDYFVFASRAGYRFSAAREVIVGPNATNVNFYVSNRVFTISGHVLEGTNGLSNVTFREFGSLITDSNGDFRISDLLPGTYTFTPRGAYGFYPQSRTVVLTNQDVTNVNFQAGTVITSITRSSNGVVQLVVYSPATSNRVEVSINLIDWVAISTNATSTNASAFVFSDKAATNFPIRFYRVVQQ